MGNKNTREYVCLNKNDQEFLEETHLEDLLDIEDRKNVPVRGENIRKSIEHHLERQQLKKNIADFDWFDEYDEH